MTWTLRTNGIESPFTADQAADRLVKRRVAKDQAEAERMVAAGNTITIPANGATAEQVLTPNAPAPVPESVTPLDPTEPKEED